MAMLEEVALAITAGSGVIPTKYGDIIGTLPDPLAGNVAIGTLPATPDACIALLEVPGSKPDETFRALPTAENEMLQVLVRHTSFASAQTTARNLWLDLHRLLEVDLSGTRWHLCSSNQSPFLLERDDSQRAVFSCTFAVKRRVMV